MEKRLTNEVLIELYKKNYTLKEIATLYGYNMASVSKRIRSLIDNGIIEERPKLRKNRITKYGKEDKIIINIKDDKSIRVITDEDIMTLIGYGFKKSRISLITGLPIDMIIDIVKKYKDQNIEEPKVNKWDIIELYNNNFNRSQIREITGYNEECIMATVNQAIRNGFINRDIGYIPTSQDKAIMNMYKKYTSIVNIAISMDLSKQEVEQIIDNLINKGLLEERNNIARILNKKRIIDGVEDELILRMYNLSISEDCIAKYYKVDKNVIINAIYRIEKNKIKIYDKISTLLKQRKSVRQISYKLNIPLEVLYNHLREVIR